MSALGTKEVESGGSEPALVFFVDRKLPLTSLRERERVPPQIDGFRTDVVALEETPPAPIASIDSPAGPAARSGVRVVAQKDENAPTQEWGTLGGFAFDAAARLYAFGAWHVFSEPKWLTYFREPSGSNTRFLGSVYGGTPWLPGAKLYPHYKQVATHKFMVDLGLVRCDPGARAFGGTPDAKKFKFKPDLLSLALAGYKDAVVYSVDPATNSLAFGLWKYNLPVIPFKGVGDLTFLALVEQSVPSDPGCSGRLWFLKGAEPAPPIAMGLHWGVKDSSSRRLALVTDLIPALQYAKLTHIGTDPQELSH